MLAFAIDISQSKPEHSQEDQNSELKEYMDYQRKLDPEKLVYHALDQAKTELHERIQEARGDQKKLEKYLAQAFPFAHNFGSVDNLMLMLRKLGNAHNSTNNWYRMNSYYYALVYDCVKRFIETYNQLVLESPDKAKNYGVSEGVAIDFDDWVQLHFTNLDFHIGNKLESVHYPFAKRNQTIEEAIEKHKKNGKSLAEALQAIKKEYEIDDISIKVLLGQEISEKDLELFYTSVVNPIYEYLAKKQEGSWGTIDGESMMDHIYGMGAHLKVWVWKKRKK